MKHAHILFISMVATALGLGAYLTVSAFILARPEPAAPAPEQFPILSRFDSPFAYFGN
jgi:hypothetical protein